MSFAIIRGANGRRHEVDFGEDEIAISLHAGSEAVELVIEAQDPNRPWDKRRFAHVNIPRNLFTQAMAELARRDQGKPHARD